MIDGEPWLVAKDVCDVLEVKNPTQAMSRLDDDERSMFNIGPQGNVNVINEPGFYRLVMRSNKPHTCRLERPRSLVDRL